MAINLQNIFATQDLTKGRPMHGIIRFAIPLLIGNLVQQLYNTVDSIVVGQYVGDEALAAVGAAGPVLNLLIVLFVGISVGGTIMVSQFFGAKSREDLDHTVGNTITLAFLSANHHYDYRPIADRSADAAIKYAQRSSRHGL